MKLNIKRGLPLACLCLMLLGIPVTMGACANLVSDPSSPTYAPNGSFQYPYPVTVSKGECTAWRIVYGNNESDPFCASTLPTRQTGMYVSLTYNGMPWTACLVDINAQRQIAYVS